MPYAIKKPRILLTKKSKVCTTYDRAIPNRATRKYINSYGLNFALLDFDDQTLHFTEVADMIEHFKRSRKTLPVSLGNGALIFKKFLGGGKDGATFVGTVAGKKENVAIKVNFDPIAKAKGNKVVVCPEQVTAMTDVIREYKMMADLDCRDPPDTGSLVCAEGMTGLWIDKNAYSVIIMEEMDDTLEHYLDKAAIKRNVIVRTQILLQAIHKLRRLHDLKFYHMDAHSQNWLVKYKNRPVSDPDVRMADMGVSCTSEFVPGMTEEDMCSAKARQYRFSDFKYMGSVEFAQFGPTVTDIMQPTASAVFDTPDLKFRWDMFAKTAQTMKDVYMKDFGSAPAKFRNFIAAKSFEFWITETDNGIEPLLHEAILGNPKYTHQIIKKWVGMGLLPFGFSK